MDFVIDGLGALFGDRGLGIFFPFLIHYFIVYNGCIHDFFLMKMTDYWLCSENFSDFASNLFLV